MRAKSVRRPTLSPIAKYILNYIIVGLFFWKIAPKFKAIVTILKASHARDDIRTCIPVYFYSPVRVIILIGETVEDEAEIFYLNYITVVNSSNGFRFYAIV